MQSVSSRIWTRVAMSISYDDNDYTTGTSNKCISMMHHNIQAVVQVNGKRLWKFMIEWSVRQGCPLYPLALESLLWSALALESLLRRLRDEQANSAQHDISFAGPLTANVTAFANDITVFVFHRLDISTVKKAVTEYERIAGAKISFDKSEGLWLGAWTGSNTLPGPFSLSDGPVRILGAKLVGCRGQGRCPGGYLASKEVVLKGQGGSVCRVHLSLVLYRLSLLSLPKARWQALQRSLTKLLWGGLKPMVCRQVCRQVRAVGV